MENAARLIESRIFNVRNYRGEFFRLRPCLIGNVNLASAKRDAPHVVLVSCATTSQQCALQLEADMASISI